MPHKIKLAEHYSGLGPKTRNDYHELLRVVICVPVSLAIVIGFRLLQEHWQQIRELTWASATGTIVDVRAGTLISNGAAYRPGPLYQEQVQVSFTLNGVLQRRWITLRKLPETGAGIQLDARRWKGANCMVRWNPSSPDQIDAEIS